MPTPLPRTTAHSARAKSQVVGRGDAPTMDQPREEMTCLRANVATTATEKKKTFLRCLHAAVLYLSRVLCVRPFIGRPSF